MARTGENAKKSTGGMAPSRQLATRCAGQIPGVKGVKKTRRFRPGTVALREIRKWQSRTDLLIPRGPFLRLCREIAQDVSREEQLGELRFHSVAVDALRECAEHHLIGMFEQIQHAAVHAKRVTIMPKDLSFIDRVYYLRSADRYGDKPQPQ